MIIQSDLIIGLGIGQAQRLVEPTDTNVRLLAAVQPQVESILPVQFADSGTTRMVNSAVIDSEITRTNQAASDVIILTLGPGLWDIDINLAVYFNWAHVAAGIENADVYAELGNRSFTMISAYAAAGSQQINRRMRMLIRENLVIHHEVGITGVAQTTDSVVFINAIKIL